MEKLGLLFKQTLGSRIKAHMESSSSVFVVKYAKLKSPDLSTLRKLLKDSKATLFVVRNAVALRAFKDSQLEGLSRHIEGSCGLVFANEEPVNACRTLYNFAKEHEQLKIEGGLLEQRFLESKDIEAISKLPSKEILRAQVVLTLKSPITNIVGVLKQNLRKFVYCLEQVKNKKPK